MKIELKPIQPDAFRRYTQWAALITALALLFTAAALAVREAVPEDFYTIRAFEDSVAIFKNGEPNPVYSIDTPLSRLTDADRTLLTAGIRVESLAEAYKRIEDYE